MIEHGHGGFAYAPEGTPPPTAASPDPTSWIIPAWALDAELVAEPVEPPQERRRRIREHAQDELDDANRQLAAAQKHRRKGAHVAAFGLEFEAGQAHARAQRSLVVLLNDGLQSAREAALGGAR